MCNYNYIIICLLNLGFNNHFMEPLWVKFRGGRRGGGLPYKSDGMLFLRVEIAVFGLT